MSVQQNPGRSDACVSASSRNFCSAWAFAMTVAVGSINSATGD